METQLSGQMTGDFPVYADGKCQCPAGAFCYTLQ